MFLTPHPQQQPVLGSMLCRSPKIFWSLPSAHSLLCSEPFPGSSLHPSSNSPSPHAHSIPQTARNNAHFQAPVHQCSHFRSTSNALARGHPLLPRPWQGQVSFRAPPGCLSLCSVRTGRGWGEGCRHPRQAPALAHTAGLNLNNKLKFWTWSRVRPEVSSCAVSKLGPPTPARPEATQMPLAWPPSSQGSPWPCSTCQYPQGPAGAVPTLPQDPVPDLPQGAPNVLGSPVASATRIPGP